jgi:serine acetyltransferase
MVNRLSMGGICVVGKHTLVIAGVVVGGSTRIGDDVWVAPSATLREHIKIGRDAFVGLGSVVLKNVPRQMLVLGVPARAVRKTEPTRIMPKPKVKRGKTAKHLPTRRRYGGTGAKAHQIRVFSRD